MPTRRPVVLLALLTVLLMGMGTTGPARGEGLRFRVFDWLPPAPDALRRDIIGVFHLEPERLPALSQGEPGTMAIVNPGGAPAAIAYAPVRVDSLLPSTPHGPGPAWLALRFEARWQGEGEPPRAGATFLTERLDYVASRDWTAYEIRAFVPGAIGNGAIAFSLRARRGRLEIRDVQVARSSAAESQAPPREGPAAPPPRPASRKHVRDVRIDRDGTMLVEGRRFLPRGLYLQENDAQAIDDAAAAGLNLVLIAPSPDVEALVRRARSKGMEVIIGGTVPPERDKIGPAVQDLIGRHAALPVLGWTGVDEPDLKPAYREAARVVYEAMVEADSRPVFQSNHSPGSFAHFAGACDIMAVDPYPVATIPCPLLTVGRWVDRARQAVGAGRSPWLINQAFAETPMWNRPPTPAELRAMTWIGLNHGARGIVYYALHELLYPAAPDYKWDLRRSDLWPEIRRESDEMRALEPWIAGGPPASLQSPVPVTGPLDVGLWWRGAEARDGLLVVVNLSDRPATGTVSLAGVGNGKIAWKAWTPSEAGKAPPPTPGAEGVSYRQEGGVLSMTLPAHGVAILLGRQDASARLPPAVPRAAGDGRPPPARAPGGRS